MYSVNGGVPKRRAPANLFQETDLYTIKMPDGTRDLSIEHGLSGLETRFADIRREVIENRGEISAENRMVLCAFVAAMRARTPKQREHVRSFWSNVNDGMTQMRDAMMAKTPAERERIGRISGAPGGGRPSGSHEDVKRMVAEPLQTTMVPAISVETPLLAKLDLAVVETTDAVGFLTSDAPCVWFDPESRNRSFPFDGPALMFPTIEITLPVSPHQLLLLNRTGRTGYFGVGSNGLLELNRRIRAYADKEFVAASDKVL